METNKLGREVEKFDTELWRSKVGEIAEQANFLKFSEVEECKGAWFGTREQILVEASPVDRNWGVGFAADEAEETEGDCGESLLATALMRVRDRLKREIARSTGSPS